jgi:carboxymethylenebutenolidase
MKKVFLPAILVSASWIAAAQTPEERLEKSPRHQEWVEVKQGDKTVHSFLVYPEVSDEVPAIILIHENRGLNDWVRGMADQFAERGYIAIAPDLLSGMGPAGGKTSDFETGDAAREALYQLDPDQITKDLNAVYDHVSKLPSSNGKVIVIGFCWGGSQSFRFATNQPNLSAAMVCYGSPPDSGYENIKAPVYGFYGGSDNRINASIPDAEKKMKELSKEYDYVIYEGAGHGFMRSGEADEGSAENKKAREEGWKRIEKILSGIKGK